MIVEGRSRDMREAQDVSRTPRHSTLAIAALLPLAGVVPRPPVRSPLTPGRRVSRRLRGRRRDRGAALAGHAVEGRAAARPVHRGEAARGRAVADRARRDGRGPLARTPRRAALLLVRRGGLAGRRQVARDAGPRARAAPMRHDHPRDRRARRPAAAAAARWREASGRCATRGIARTKTCSPHGSRSCSTIRSTPRRHGRRCTRCCATGRATSCSTIWVSAKTR